MRPLAVTFVALAVATVGIACGSPSDEAAPPPPPATVTEPSAEGSSREAAPPLAGVSLDGEAIALGDFRGRPVLVNVWSSW